jgi:hypothetical protein
MTASNGWAVVDVGSFTSHTSAKCRASPVKTASSLTQSAPTSHT